MRPRVPIRRRASNTDPCPNSPQCSRLSRPPIADAFVARKKTKTGGPHLRRRSRLASSVSEPLRYGVFFTVIFLPPLADCTFGKTIESTPFLKEASTFSLLTSAGSAMERWNEP